MESSLFCRHNRFTADCRICRAGTVLDPDAPTPARSGDAASGSKRAGAGRPASPARTRRGAGYRQSQASSGAHVTAGPYSRDGERYEVRLERVVGGVRLGEWSAGRVVKRAPVLAAADLPGLIAAARERAVLDEQDLQALERALSMRADRPPGDALFGASPGRSGEFQEELRVEALEDGGLARIGRWVLRPGAGWTLNDAPTVLPAKRYAEALEDAARLGLLGPG